MIVVAGEALVDLLVDATGAVAARPGGGPFNVARGLARLGAPSAFLGALSTDAFGRRLRAVLAEDGVQLDCVRDTELPTTLAVAQLDGGAASYSFYAAGTAAPALTDAALPAGTTALHVGTLGLALEPMAGALEALAERVDDGVLLMVDPNCRPSAIADEDAYRARVERVLGRAHAVKVSTDDLAYLGAGPHELLRGRARCVLVTDGPRPARVLTRAGERAIPPVASAVVDTVGAGDAFCAGFLAWWTAAGHGPGPLADLERVGQAATFAMLVAARTCERSGAEPPRLDDLQAAARF